MTTRILGLDIAAHCGYVVAASGRAGTVIEDQGIWHQIGRGMHPMKRLNYYSSVLLELLQSKRVDGVVIEGYAFSKMQGKDSIVLQCGIGTMMRFTCISQDVPYVEVAPSQLKKFVTGKGVAPKEVMVKEVYKRWGFDTSDHNIADAFALAQFGLAMLGKGIDLPKANMDAVAKAKETDLAEGWMGTV